MTTMLSSGLGLTLAIGLIALAVLTIGFASWLYFNPTRTATDRLADLAGRPQVEEARDLAVERLAERLGQLANPQSEEERDRQKQRLIQAGYRSRHAGELFNAIRVALALGLPLLSVPFVANASMANMAMVIVGLAASGYYLPQLVLSSQIEKRRKTLLASFPDSLDLLVSSVEAGLGLDAAFRRVADEMRPAAPELSREFQLVNAEISAGFTRVDALRHLEHRTGLDEVKSLVNMLTQAERFGTSVARSLRIHSQITRQKRMSRAEEEAAKVSPKLTVVMILFLMPSLMVVLLGPAIVQVKNNLMD